MVADVILFFIYRWLLIEVRAICPWKWEIRAICPVSLLLILAPNSSPEQILWVVHQVWCTLNQLVVKTCYHSKAACQIGWAAGFIMKCIELCVIDQKLSITLKSEDLAILPFKKNSRHTHQNRLKLSPVSERSAYSLQNYVCFSPLTSKIKLHEVT